MNAAESIVETYFRLCKGALTITDVKVGGGVNRQIDLLAYSPKKRKAYHVETTVTHREAWCPGIEEIYALYRKKFCGEPPDRKGQKTDKAKGKNYQKNIEATYSQYGLNGKTINKVFVFWATKDIDVKELEKLRKKVQIISLRDEILPELMKGIATSCYDDLITRAFSFDKERIIQQMNKKKVRLGKAETDFINAYKNGDWELVKRKASKKSLNKADARMIKILDKKDNLYEVVMPYLD